ncbi:MAG: hypothetical protein IJQ90_01100 [Alphaproteobacteria bacterium]|nr:hypothetical protein [Alphaproteobacteria bacterium]
MMYPMGRVVPLGLRTRKPARILYGRKIPTAYSGWSVANMLNKQRNWFDCS